MEDHSLEIYLNAIAIGISIISLLSSAYIGKKQVEISKTMADAENKTELYLSAEPVTKRDVSGNVPDFIIPGITIWNVGNNVVYLENYIFNGRDYPLGKYVLPPTNKRNVCRYIELPTDGSTHVSFLINLQDWQGHPLMAKGYVDFVDGKWDITYTPCEPRT